MKVQIFLITLLLFSLLHCSFPTTATVHGSFTGGGDEADSKSTPRVLHPDNVVVSLAIDSSSVEIQREAIRLLTSIYFFGGTLSQAHINICINHEIEEGAGDDSVNAEVMRRTQVLVDRIHLLEFERLSISYSKSLPYPAYAPSLNKMCAFDPQLAGGVAEEREVKYLLYLDADIFVAQDPLLLIAEYLPLHRGADTYILCGRPFSSKSLQNIDFEGFVGMPNNPFLNSSLFPLLPTLDGGQTYYGMCNTGVYFLELETARELAKVADEYLVRANALTPKLPANFLIDSYILWAAQQMMHLRVEIFSSRLNYIVPADRLYENFLHEERTLQQRSELVAETHVITDIALMHFSRGSDLHFAYEGVDKGCLILGRGCLDSAITSFFSTVFQEGIGVSLCLDFNNMLEIFTDYVTTRDDTASNYFRSSS